MTEERRRPLGDRIYEAFADLYGTGVQANTRAQYASRFETMEIFRKEEGQEKWSLPLFVLFLHVVKRCGYADGESFRSALLHTLEYRGEPAEWLREKRTIKVTQSIKFNHEIQKTPKGSVSAVMLSDFIQFLRNKSEDDLIAPAFVLHNAALRGHELINVRQGDFREERTSAFTLLIRGDKRVKRSNARPKHYEKDISKTVFEVLKALAKDTPHGELLFPEGSRMIRRLRSALKEAAVTLQWPTALKFDGPHVLRHGGTSGLFKRAQEAVAEEYHQQRINTIKHYASSNKTRQA
jgi:hypothetical protein